MTLREAVELVQECLHRAESNGISRSQALDRVRRGEYGAREFEAVRLLEREQALLWLRSPKLYRLIVCGA